MTILQLELSKLYKNKINFLVMIVIFFYCYSQCQSHNIQLIRK